MSGDDLKVVNNEEQPVDVQQAARSMPPRVVMPGPISGAGNALAAAPTTPERSIIPPEPALTPMPPVPGLGEPRKVRTVAIRPDGTPVQNPVAIDSPIATGSAPSRSLASRAFNSAASSAASITPDAETAPEAMAPAREIASCNAYAGSFASIGTSKVPAAMAAFFSSIAGTASAGTSSAT